MSGRRLLLLAATLALAPLLAFPLAVLADGGARFPSRDECAAAATADAPDLDVVYARLDDLAAAEALLTELTQVGFTGAELELDACGRWRVFYDGIPSLAQGQALVDQVRQAGFEARVELGG